MRVGFVRNVGLGMVALVGLGVAGCDDSPTSFDTAQTVKITTNPSVMVIPAGVTTLLESRTENAGNEPTFDEVTATVDPTCGAASLSIAEAASFEPSVQPPGRFDVTGGTTRGTTCVNLSGGGASAVVEVTIVGDSLIITGAPATIEPATGTTTAQLGVSLVADDGSPVTPFDPVGDVVWTSDNTAVLTVDANGLVTAVGPGAATITATVTDAGVTTSESVTIEVLVPPPSLVSLTPGSADAGSTITITGTGLIPGFHSIFVDGFAVDPFLDPMVTSSTTATFRLPPGANGAVGVEVGVPGDVSIDSLTLTRTGDTEPANNDPSTAPLVTLPLNIVGFMDHDADPDDFYQVVIAVPTTIQIDLDWNTVDADDLDVLVTNASVSSFFCGFVAATGDQPETGQCTLAPGIYYIYVNSFAGGQAIYELSITLP